MAFPKWLKTAVVVPLGVVLILLVVSVQVVGEPVVVLGVFYATALKLHRWASEGAVQRYLAVLIMLAVALLLFYLRSVQRAFYGWVEVFVGGLTTYAVLGSPKLAAERPEVVFLAVASAVYVTVRGFDNIAQGLDPVRARAKTLAELVRSLFGPEDSSADSRNRSE